MYLKTQQGDTELYESNNEKALRLLIDKNAIIKPIKKDLMSIISKLGGSGTKDINKENLIPENPIFQKALKIIYHASNTRRKNPAMIGEFNNVYYKDAKKMLQAAQEYLAQEYDGEFNISGEFIGKDREHWDKIKTPYGIYIDGDWNKEETNKPYGTIISKKEGVHLGDQVIYKGKNAIIIDASHEHGGLGEGTARIEIKYPDGNTEKVVPWALKKS